MTARLRREEGWTIVTALFVMTVMLGLGLGMLSIVDTQTAESRKERVADASFNLAEGVLNSTAFLLSRSWPELPAQSPTGSPTACSAQQLSGGLGAGATDTMAGRVQQLVTDTFTAADYAGATWTVNVCDDLNREASWSDAVLGAWSYDQNGPHPSSGTRRLWVRAQATVRGRTKAVAALVQVNEAPALPPRYGLVAGRLRNDLQATTGALLTGAVLGPVAESLLGTKKLVGPDPTDPSSGKMGLRCGVLSGCLTGALSAVSSTALAPLLGVDIVQYADSSVAGDETVKLLRRQAEAAGTYYASRPANGPCIPAGTSTAGRIVFIEQVGDGDQRCYVELGNSVNVQAKALIVASGRAHVRGDHAGSSPNALSDSGRFTGVVWALNRQATGVRSESGLQLGHVTISHGARVRGAVYADGAQGTVNVIPPPFDLNAVLNNSGLCSGLLGSITCGALRALGVTDLLSELVNLLGLLTVVNALTAQISTYGPAVQYDTAVVTAVKTYGSSGTISGTFREIPAG